MAGEGQRILDPEAAWPLVRAAAQRGIGEEYQSTQRRCRYRIIRVDARKIIIDRLDGNAHQETLSEREVSRGIAKLNAEGGRVARSQLYGNVAKEVTLVRLHPDLQWAGDNSMIGVRADRSSDAH